ncbi:hypothetical protein [Streptomyces spiramenti]|uniref:Uncharacterized protein n=1 Tax=Streptomyces spiramenti TaxID=2720606 RepID=A0ABX1AMG0_9ACTN|nr:hypothetical protein [Streptomyces spiramenti]NJP66598.1 hypothetical protein [Streptomyces spiramenti]
MKPQRCVLVVGVPASTACPHRSRTPPAKARRPQIFGHDPPRTRPAPTPPAERRTPRGPA